MLKLYIYICAEGKVIGGPNMPKILMQNIPNNVTLSKEYQLLKKIEEKVIQFRF